MDDTTPQPGIRCITRFCDKVGVKVATDQLGDGAPVSNVFPYTLRTPNPDSTCAHL